MRKQTFFNILLIITTVTAIGVFISMVYLFQQSANESAILNEKEQMELDVRLLSERIDEQFQLAEEQLNLLTESEEVQSGSNNDCTEGLSRIASFINNEFDYFARTNNSGVINCASNQSFIGSSLFESEQELISVLNNNEVQYKIVNNQANGDKTSLNTVIPLYGGQSQLVGSLSSAIYLNDLGDEFVRMEDNNQNREVMLLGLDGQILYTTSDEDLLITYKESTMTDNEIRMLDAVIERINNEATDTIEQNGLVASYSLQVSGSNFQWIAVMSQPKKDMINTVQVESGFLSGPESVLGLGMVMIIVGVGVVLLIMLYSNRIFFKPIKAISRALKKASDGDLHTKISLEEYAKNDEFYILSSGFNQMIESVRKSTEELETLVSARTEDLMQAKSDLESAKKSLEDKVKELERLNNLMIGREMRMIELKDEIERLKKESPDADSEDN